MYQNGQSISYNYMMQYQQPMYQPMIYAHPVLITPLPPYTNKLGIDLPTFEYSTDKHPIVPFDKVKSHDGKFETITDAMKFISEHCLKHHGIFNRNLAKAYSQFCQILSLTDGGYIHMPLFDKKQFNTAFSKYYRKQ